MFAVKSVEKRISKREMIRDGTSREERITTLLIVCFFTTLLYRRRVEVGVPGALANS